MKHPLSLAVLLALSTSAFALDAPKFDPQRLSDEVKTLSSDAFQGRGPATEGEKLTVAWIIEQMQGAGLQPGGDLKDGKRGWTQAVPLLRADIDGTPRLDFTIAGKADAMEQGKQIAVRAPLDGSKEVSIDKAPVVFVGYGVSAPERNWDDFKGMDVRGKLLICLVNDPDFETGTGDFGGKAMTYYGRWTYKFEEAARRGAAGLLVVHETAPASYGWPTVKNSNNNTMFDIVRKNPAQTHPALEGWIQRDVAADLLKRAGLDFDTLKKQAQTRQFKPTVLKDVNFSAHYAVRSEVITSHNVVGRVEGSKYPDETVLYSAHWDHLGIGQPDAKGDRIYNGAIDNATGTASLIELGRAFAHAQRPQRSVVFLAVTAEEKGLLGSEYYADNPLYPLATTAGVLNTDALSPLGPTRDFSTSGKGSSQLLDLLIADGKKMGRVFKPDSHLEAGYFFRSDHFPFAKRGVPAVSFGSGSDLIDGDAKASEAEQADYGKNRYHQPADEWHASWPFTGLAKDLELLYRVGSDLANSRQWPTWSKDSEFRAAREASAAQRK